MKSTEELLGPLTVNQKQCIVEEIGQNKLIYVEEAAGTDAVYIGYHSRDDFYVTILSADIHGDCIIEFQERVWSCYEERVEWACIEGYEFRPKDVQALELTGNAPHEIYISFDTRGVGARNNAHHIFYVEEPIGEYKALLHLDLCLGLSSVEINESSQTIIATDDLVCDMFHGRKEHLEFSLRNGELTVLADWFDD